MEIISPTPRDMIITIRKGDIPIDLLTWLASINKSGSAIEIIKPIKIPNIITFIILSNLPKKSPIMVPIFETDRSTPYRKIERPRITPRDPSVNLISKSVERPTKKFNMYTKITIGRTALVLSLIFSKNIYCSLCF